MEREIEIDRVPLLPTISFLPFPFSPRFSLSVLPSFSVLNGDGVHADIEMDRVPLHPTISFLHFLFLAMCYYFRVLKVDGVHVDIEMDCVPLFSFTCHVLLF